MSGTDIVCRDCGVALTESRSGRLIHADALPRGTDPEHAASPVSREEWEDTEGRRFALKLAVEDLLLHHGTLHPISECEWADAVYRALSA